MIYYYESMIEAVNFPGWELYIFLNTMLWISIILRLSRIEKNTSKEVAE